MTTPNTEQPMGTVGTVAPDHLELAYKSLLQHISQPSDGPISAETVKVLDQIGSSLPDESNATIFTLFKRSTALFQLISQLEAALISEQEANGNEFPSPTSYFSRDNLPDGIYVLAADAPLTEYKLADGRFASYDEDHFNDVVTEILIAEAPSLAKH